MTHSCCGSAARQLCGSPALRLASLCCLPLHPPATCPPSTPCAVQDAVCSVGRWPAAPAGRRCQDQHPAAAQGHGLGTADLWRHQRRDHGCGCGGNLFPILGRSRAYAMLQCELSVPLQAAWPSALRATAQPMPRPSLRPPITCRRGYDAIQGSQREAGRGRPPDQAGVDAVGRHLPGLWEDGRRSPCLNRVLWWLCWRPRPPHGSKSAMPSLPCVLPAPAHLHRAPPSAYARRSSCCGGLGRPSPTPPRASCRCEQSGRAACDRPQLLPWQLPRPRRAAHIIFSSLETLPRPAQTHSCVLD